MNCTDIDPNCLVHNNKPSLSPFPAVCICRGMQNTDQAINTQCGCLCHSTGIPHVKASNPPQPCCSCDILLHSYKKTPLNFDGIKNIMGEDRIGKLEEIVKNHVSCINNLAQHKNHQIEENKLISKRMDELEAEFTELKNFSQKISEFYNKFKSELREFEKQKVEPLSKRISDSNEIRRILVNELRERLDRLEQSREANSRSNKELFERIDKLEKNHLESCQSQREILKMQTEPYADKPKNDAHSGCQTPVESIKFPCHSCGKNIPSKDDNGFVIYYHVDNKNYCHECYR